MCEDRAKIIDFGEFKDFKTNSSTNGKRIYLPTFDPEWVSLLVNLLEYYEVDYNRRERDYFENRFVDGYAYKTLPYSSCFYRKELLNLLLVRKSISYDEAKNYFLSTQRNFDEDYFREGWYRVRTLIAMVIDDYMRKSGDYKPLCIGKAKIRAILTDEQKEFSDRHYWKQFIQDSDYVESYSD
ncbi:MAG: hypothetical protein HPY85_13135 [Anaerolineae bacterium]|nr:hypothetical protein [Anaerolineae bacterium]